MKVLLINVGRSYAAQDMAYATAVELNADILFICEPNKKRVQNNIWLKDTRTNVAAILLNRNLEVQNHKACEGYLIVSFEKVNFVCCYISPNIDILDYKNEVDQIMGNVQGQEYVILGDFNAKSPYWGSPVQNEKGHYWVEWLSARDMVVHNAGDRPTFVRGTTESHIDVTVSTSEVAKLINNWEVLETESLTEHKYICFDCHQVTTSKRRAKQRSVVDWETFRNTLQLIGKSDGKTTHKYCTKIIKEALRNSTSTRRHDMDGSTYWWNKDIEEKRALCNKLRRKITRSAKYKNINDVELNALRVAHRIHKRELSVQISEAKTKCWNDLCNELDNNIWGDAYKLVVKKFNKLAPYEINSAQKKRVFIELFPPARGEWTDGVVVPVAQKFTTEELTRAANCMRSGRAPGIDRIPPEAVKLLANDRPDLMLTAMNKLLDTQKFPEQWKISRAILILKSGKPMDQPSSFRPLCMLNTMSKMLEILIRNRLSKELEEGKDLHKQQFGFRKGRSTIQALGAALEAVQKCDTRWCALIAIDVQNAFNSASHRIIIEQLRKRNISDYLVNFISSYLRNRKIEIDQGVRLECGSGVPQGSVLGPTLWNVLYDGVLSLDLTVDATMIAFADDLALIVGGRDEETLTRNGNKCLEEINMWMKEHELTLAPAKTEAVIVKGGRRREHVTFNLDRVTIIPKRFIRYLGVIIDEKRNFGEHIRMTTSKAEKRVAALSRILPNVGGPKSSKRAVLCGALHNILLYGAPVWIDALEIRRNRDLLVRAQRNMLLRVASAYRTVSAVALQVVTGTVPVDLMARERTALCDDTEGRKPWRTEARERSFRMWQERWNNEVDKAQWTKRLIKDIKRWTDCKHREVGYYLTQVITGHGCFRHYAKRFGKDTSDKCLYCDNMDTAEHTFFVCDRWEGLREPVWKEVGTLTPDNMVDCLISSKENWQKIHGLANKIMKIKEIEERARQILGPQ